MKPSRKSLRSRRRLLLRLGSLRVSNLKFTNCAARCAWGPTGDAGKILRVSAEGKVDTFATLTEREVTALRVGPDGQHAPQVMVALTQSRPIKIEGANEERTFSGGSTLVVDLSKPAIDYAIIKRLDSSSREERTTAFLTNALKDPLRALMIAPDQNEPFAGLHALADVTS